MEGGGAFMRGVGGLGTGEDDKASGAAPLLNPPSFTASPPSLAASSLPYSTEKGIGESEKGSGSGSGVGESSTDESEEGSDKGSEEEDAVQLEEGSDSGTEEDGPLNGT